MTTKNKLDEESPHNPSNLYSMPVGIHWVGPDGEIIRTTHYELEMLGYTHEEFIGLNIADIHVDKKEAENILQKVKIGGELHDYSTQLRCKDGAARHVIINTVVDRKNGELISTRFCIRDITKNKRGVFTNALLAAIIDNSNDAIISCDLGGPITSWNASAERLFGIPPESIGRNIHLLFPDERADEVNDILDQLKKGERIEQSDTTLLHKDGTPRHVSLVISPVKDSKGRVAGASLIARDISKRKSYQKQLRSLASKLSKAEEQERNRIATELHDNLGQLLTMSKMKLDQLAANEGAESLDSEIDELTDLLNEAITFTRNLMSELKPPPALDHEHFGRAVLWVVEKMKQHNLTVTIEDDKQPKPLDGELQTVLLQSIKELLLNVVKHAGVDEAKVVISRNDNHIEIDVIDDGEGFELTDKELISYQDEKGFGLFNIKERVDLVGGDFKLESAPGKGTRAKLVAPLKEKEETAALENTKAAVDFRKPFESTSGEKIKVLLVDDHKMMRRGIRRLIEEEEDMIVIGEASDGAEAVELVLETSPDVILMDINMPGMNGIETTKKILTENPYPIVIGLSVHEREDVEKAIKNAGATAYLSKNEAFEILCATIRSEVTK